jgi:hypothetical protein
LILCAKVLRKVLRTWMYSQMFLLFLRFDW